MRFQLTGRKHLVITAATHKPPFAATSAAGKSRFLDNIAWLRAVLVGIINRRLARSAETRWRALAYLASRLQVSGGIWLADLVNLQVRARPPWLPKAEDGLVRTLPKPERGHSFVCVMPDQPALLVNREAGGNPGHDLRESVEINQPIIGEQAKAIAEPAQSPMHIFVNGHDFIVVAKVLANVVWRVGDDDIKDTTASNQLRQLFDGIAVD